MVEEDEGGWREDRRTSKLMWPGRWPGALTMWMVESPNRSIVWGKLDRGVHVHVVRVVGKSG